MRKGDALEETTDVERIEIRLLLEAMYQKYGYDFRGYAEASITRRIHRHRDLNGFRNVSEIHHAILGDRTAFLRLLHDLSISVTEMFRDPSFYGSLRKNVLPLLKKLPFIRIWLAGSATGEEVYSIAILLEEEGILGKAQIYATDINEAAIDEARQGIYPLARIQDYTRNYHKAGGKRSFGDYYTARYGHAAMRVFLKQHILFSHHNLVTDGSFGEMHLIVCRNVLIYFSKELQDRVLQLFGKSLIEEGFLCLGSKETLRYSLCSTQFQEWDPHERIYRKRAIGS